MPRRGNLSTGMAQQRMKNTRTSRRVGISNIFFAISWPAVTASATNRTAGSSREVSIPPFWSSDNKFMIEFQVAGSNGPYVKCLGPCTAGLGQSVARGFVFEQSAHSVRNPFQAADNPIFPVFQDKRRPGVGCGYHGRAARHGLGKRKAKPLIC